ncbi:MAG: hypothetical protein HY718_13925 [Planctomycetes bacterium]|nr:hypothetical protein [Planctomycetota bacterium]
MGGALSSRTVPIEPPAFSTAIGRPRVPGAARAAHMGDFPDSHLPASGFLITSQYENVKTNGLWATIQPFADISDVYAFGSYPSVPLDGPDSGFTAATLPDDYYAPIRARLGSSRPVAFVELGPPAAPSGFFSAGSEQEQADFIRRLFAVLPAGTSLAVWTYLYDPAFLTSIYQPEVADYFSSLGLLRIDPPGLESPGWQEWQAISSGS